ncbi:hypothetical protein DFR86_02230 [Acidianus sulfidivorans JP7]|uniref:Uncharacterized protein n=1 Tax=Acidianus sulfidivorans JP7 TaxID=619593 RepID=A0A2U9IKN3_9CREN|nr:hypothetical protein [Acidianus sulfidivorans]AWR96484.1 hypothetical protein DFR86_02230 [Acidianus sulfidivorans JP7]
MNNDERTTTEAMIEIHFNLYELRESIASYRIIDENDWITLSSKEGDYLLKEFDTYGILIYPSNVKSEIKNAFSQRLEKIDKFREALYKPQFWREYITIYIDGDTIYTGDDLNLEFFNGIDLVNSILKSKGIEFNYDESRVRITVKVSRPLNSSIVNHAMENLSRAISLYFRIKEAQEDIAEKLAMKF